MHDRNDERQAPLQEESAVVKCTIGKGDSSAIVTILNNIHEDRSTKVNMDKCRGIPLERFPLGLLCDQATQAASIDFSGKGPK